MENISYVMYFHNFIFRHHLVICNNLKTFSLEIMTCLCQQSSWQSSLVWKMAKGYVCLKIHYKMYHKVTSMIGCWEEDAAEAN